MTRSDSWQASRRLAALEAHTGEEVLVPAAARETLEAAASEVQDPWGRALRLA